MIDSTNIVQVIENVGFPIAITIYLLHRFEKRIEKLEEVIISLVETCNQSTKE